MNRVALGQLFILLMVFILLTIPAALILGLACRLAIEKGAERLQPTLSGRDRVNINAVINAKDPIEVIVEECKSVNAQTTKALYQKIIDANPDKTNNYIISDNARYYRNKELMAWIENTPIKPIFLPPYSPNLNLIERLWKFMRKKIINTQFYRTKEEFRQAIVKFFTNIKQYKDELSCQPDKKLDTSLREIPNLCTYEQTSQKLERDRKINSSPTLSRTWYRIHIKTI
jgi:transposase